VLTVIWRRAIGRQKKWGGQLAEFPALPLWTDAYIADTQHLTNEEHGVYLRLLMFAWRTPDCALPDDDKRLAIMVGVTPKKWTLIKASVMSFWTLSEGSWRQKKLSSEREFVERQRKQKSAAGKASAASKSLKNNNVEPTAVGTKDSTEGQHKGNNPYPYPHPRKKEEPNGSSKRAGSRLPDDWMPDEVFAKSEGLSASECAREADKFRDYWRGQSGQRGVKADWTATWKNWVRKVADDRRKGVSTHKPSDWRTEPEYRGVL
jgi:uncharacterized protein YdaU (DUF1376 family)